VPLVVVPPDSAAYRAACGKRCLEMPDVPSAVARQVRLMDVPATVLAILGLPAICQQKRRRCRSSSQHRSRRTS
jgi:hypothetical protein